MVRAGLITQDSAVHLAALHRCKGEGETLCSRVRAPGGQPGSWVRLQARVSGPALHRQRMTVKQEEKKKNPAKIDVQSPQGENRGSGPTRLWLGALIPSPRMMRQV